MRTTSRALALTAVFTLMGAGLARAADFTLPGHSMSIKDTKLFKSTSKGSFTVPTSGGASDPTANASSLTADDFGSSGALTEADLDSSLWKGLGNPAGIKGYVYSNPNAAAGTDPVRKIVLKSKVIKIITRDDGTLDGPVSGAVGLFLNVGADTYCARYGGNTVQNVTGSVKRTDAPPPPDCAVPAPPVCGNGVMEAPGEECDDGGTSAGDGCSATCQLESVNPAVCAGVPSASGTALALELVADGLDSPVHVASPRLDTNRLFIVEQSGRILIVKNGVLLGTPFLDIEGLVAYSGGSEEGLLSVAFDPAYETNGRFFVYYVNNSSDITIARYTATGDPLTSDDADETSAVIVTTVPHPGAGNHNGGQLQFGPGGFLYAGTGDGGGGCDPDDNGQDDTNALGKLLRLDTTASFPIDPVTAIWNKGLRNPFRFSFDRGTGDLYIGDVGQNMWEEIDVDASPVGSGVNYGWDFYEATHCSSDAPSSCANACPAPVGLTMPVLEYDHGDGCSIAGGYVYRGCAMSDIVGTYFYSDYCASFVRTFEGVLGGVAQNQDDVTSDIDPTFLLGTVSSFGEDARGELYIVDHAGFSAGDGEVYRIVLE
jgi:cysteine-rich repeat protein